MLEAISKARSFIVLEMYLIESGHVANRFLDALIAATKRGVQVKVIFDAFGARALNHYDRDRLRNEGVGVVFYNPLRPGKVLRNMFRDHRKILVVDGQVAYVGGTGLTDYFDRPEKPEHSWHDIMVEIRGPIVRDWSRLFSFVWERICRQSLSLKHEESPRFKEDMTGRVTGANGLLTEEVKRSFLRNIRVAKKRVWMATAYFVPSWRIRRALRSAAKKGVDVRLLLPGPYTDHPAVRVAGHRFYSRLLRQGVRIFEYQPRVFHAKAMLCDDWSSIGSSNLDRWGMKWNLEANQEVMGADFAEQVAAWFDTGFAQSQEVDYATWRKRSLLVRLSQWFWGQVDIWLNRLKHGRHGPDI